jgi:Ca-activated chloride channel family protein
MSLDACEKDFPDMTSRNVIILITDGLEECGGDPCEASLRLQRKGVILKPFVIGLGHIQNLKAFDCVGTVYDASNESTFRNVLNVIISQAVNNTTAQVNLLDETNKATETNVNMTFYDMQRHTVKYNFVHTMNSKGLPDTLRIDPDILYRIQVNTIPPAFKDSVRLATGKHTIIPIPTPQGDLLLTYDNKSDYKNLQAIIRKANDPNTLHVQRFNATERYITGKYDVEVLSIPRLTIKDVEISQSQVTKVEIPQPGLGTFVSNSAGFGSLYIEDSDKLTWVYNLDKNYTRETLVLQPGKYRAVFRSKNAKESNYTVEKSFEIISGVSSSINLF